MDVRCEKCLTVYDFDEAQVGAGGVTVKCTQCGNLFKVKRREPTGETRLGAAVARGSAAPSAPTPAPAPPAAATSWAVRLASTGEIFRFREMTTLQQWIVERKVVREDEISRDERTWKPLGGIPDLDPFFRTVAQAMSVDAAPSLPVADFESGPLTPTAYAPTLPPPSRTPYPPPPVRAPAPPPVAAPPVAAPLAAPSVAASLPPPAAPRPAARESSGPSAFGSPASVVSSGRSGPVALGAKLPLPAVVDELASAPDDDDLAPARRGPPKWVMIGIPAGVLVVAGVFVLALGGKKIFGGKGGSGDGRRSSALVDSGYEKLRSDGDDAFRQAADLFAQARTADPDDARALAGLAETKATWAFYLREDARLLETQGAPAQSIAQTLRKQAQAALDEGKRAATDALALAPEAPEVNRAMGDLLRVDGASAAEVERYLKRSLDKVPSDPAANYVMGALLLREGKTDDAKSRLTQANTLEQAARKQPLLRADYLLAKIAAGASQRDEAKRLVAEILAVNPQHERAKALSAQLDATPAAPTVATPPTTPPSPTAPAAATPPAVTPSPTSAPGATAAADPSASGDYNKIVAQADRLLENGRTDPARKLYEKALALRPDGVEAVTGLGYCDLDRERFLGAVDHFKKALQISPEYGEALIGLAESYKVRGERAQAIEYYHRYLKVQPNGPRASMVQKNIRELEAKGGSTPAPSAPPTEAATPAPKPEAKPEPKPEAKAEGDGAPKALPKPPPTEQPPP